MATPVDKAGGKFWTIKAPTGPVYVWAPDGYSGTNVILYVHGYYVNAKQAIDSYRLLDQFRVSGVGAYFIVPEAPDGNDQPVFFPDLAKLLATVGSELGLVLKGPYSAIGHSGAYRTLAKWLTVTGLNRIVLLDALYGNVADFTKWAAQSGNKLISVAATAGPLANTNSIKGKPGVEVQIIKESHMGIVTGGKLIPEFIKKIGGGNLAIILIALAVAAGAWFLR